MPSYHGWQIRSAGLPMYSRSCSGRIVGKTEVIDAKCARSNGLSLGAQSSLVPKELHLTAQIEFSFYERYFNP